MSGASRTSSERGSWALLVGALVAIVCCAAPGLIAVAGGVTALALGGVGGTTVLAIAVVAAVRLRRRRACRTIPGGHP